MAHITVPEIEPFIEYSVGGGGQTSFTIPATWAFFSESTDIRVFKDGVELTYQASPSTNDEFSVSGTAGTDDGYLGGTVTLGASVASVTISLQRDVPTLRTEDFPYPSSTLNIQALNTALDKIAAWAQQLLLKINRSIRLADGDAAATLTLPTATSRASKVLAFDSNGDVTVSTEDLSDIEGAATSATAAAASATAAAASETAAATSETNAAASEAAAAAAAQGWADTVSVTAGTTNIETTDARKYYILDASGGSITMNLPAVGTEDGLTLGFEVLDASNSITIARDGTDTINGVAGDYTSLSAVGDVVHFIAVDGTPDDWSARLISRFVVDGTTITQSGRTISVGDGGVDTPQLADDAVDPTKAIAGRNAQTGTTYTLALTDNLKTVSLNNAGAVAVTVPTNASVAFTADETRIDLVNLGAGEVTVSGDTGVTINGVSAGSFTLAQYAGASLLKIDTNTWLAPNSTVA
jgi:hypothetical protein